MMHMGQCTPPDHHRAKRPFQPAITSFFACDDHSFSPRRESLVSAMPAPVQADLLTVGMRVRKSGPDAYKTPKRSLPTIQTPPRLAVQPPPPSPPSAAPDDAQHQRELLPFCGLHNIGGFAEQPTTNPHLYTPRADSPHARPTHLFPLPPQAFSMPFLNHGSFDSGYGSDSRPHNPSKRSWTDDDDNNNTLAPSFAFSIPVQLAVDYDVPVSPLSANPPPAFSQLPPPRTLAQPKSRRQQRPAQPDTDMDMDMDYDDADLPDGSEVMMGGV
jgi:hypothetical protein